MKKLIMCVAAVLSACALNAASVSWGVGDLFDDGFESLVGTITLASGSYSDTQTIADGGVTGSFSGFNWGEDPFSTGASWTLTANIKGADGSMYEKVFGGITLGTIDPADDRANISAFEGLTVDAQSALLPEGVLDISDLASAGWTKTGGGGVPEPTSGLLLLVGGAMLALRRKRA